MGNISSRFYLTFIEESRYRFFLEGLEMTLFLTLGSFLLGTLIGILLCAALRSRRHTVVYIGRSIVSFFIQMPTMVLLMLMVYIVFGSSSLSVVLIVLFGLTLKAGAYLAEIFYSALETVNSGEMEAARTLGMSARTAFLYVSLPQIISAALPLYKNQFIITMQETSIVGYLAIMDLTRASSIVTARTLDALFGLLVITIIYFGIGIVFQQLLGLLGRRKHLGGTQQ